MKVTLDTNVLVSGTFWTGDSFRILERIDHGEIVVVLSFPILKEYVRTIMSDEIIEKMENKKLIISKVVQAVIKKSDSLTVH